MKEIPLTKGKVALVDDEDYEHLSQFKWYATLSMNDKWYARNETFGYMHRHLLNSPKELQIDHVDNDGLNNVRTNLRVATRSQNCANRCGYSKTGFKGVTATRNRFVANIGYKRIKYCLGYFSTPEEAAHAYDRKARELHGEFAYLNFPENNFAETV